MKITKEVKIGIIILITLSIVFWGINFLKGKNIFSKHQVYYALFDEIGGLEETSAVYLSGYQIGIVESVNFLETQVGKIIVRFSIDNSIAIPENSIASIYGADLLGTKAIKIILSENESLHNSGDTLLTRYEGDLLTQIAPIKDKVEGVILSIDSVLQILNGNSRKNIRNIIENLDKTSQGLNNLVDEEKAKISSIVGNFNDISSTLNNNNQKISNILNNFDKVSDSLAQIQFNATMGKLQSTISNFNSISAKIESGEGSIGMLIHNDSLYNNLNKLSADLDLLIKDINENPKKYVQISLIERKNK